VGLAYSAVVAYGYEGRMTSPYLTGINIIANRGQHLIIAVDGELTVSIGRARLAINNLF
jgi:hypothetical protein